MRHPFFLIIIVALVVSACKGEEEKTPELISGNDFQPLIKGSYSVYDVSFIRRIPGGYDTLSYQMKEQLGEPYLTGKDTTFDLSRFIKYKNQTEWNDTPDTAWTIRRSGGNLVRTENNVPYIKLVSPLKEKLTWNGNALNTLGEDEYKISDLGKAYKVSSKDFASTLTVVQQADTTNLVKRDLALEVYARNKGLIYKKKEFWNLEFNTGKKTSGYIFEQKLLDSSL